jgi:hypothetical protein
MRNLQYPAALRQGLLIFKMVFNTPPPLGAVKTGGAGDLFLLIRKDFNEKSSIPRRSTAGIID